MSVVSLWTGAAHEAPDAVDVAAGSRHGARQLMLRQAERTAPEAQLFARANIDFWRTLPAPRCVRRVVHRGAPETKSISNSQRTCQRPRSLECGILAFAYRAALQNANFPFCRLRNANSGNAHPARCSAPDNSGHDGNLLRLPEI
jgi:hypothetical protein